MQKECQKETKEDNISMIKEIDLGVFQAITIMIGKLCKSKMKKGEAMILSAALGNKVAVWIYPRDITPEVVQHLAAGTLAQVTNVMAIKKINDEKQKIKEAQEHYVM